MHRPPRSQASPPPPESPAAGGLPAGRPPCPLPRSHPVVPSRSPPGVFPVPSPGKRSRAFPARPSPQHRHANLNICERLSPPWEQPLYAEFTCPSNA